MFLNFNRVRSTNVGYNLSRLQSRFGLLKADWLKKLYNLQPRQHRFSVFFMFICITNILFSIILFVYKSLSLNDESDSDKFFLQSTLFLRPQLSKISPAKISSLKVQANNNWRINPQPAFVSVNL